MFKNKCLYAGVILLLLYASPARAFVSFEAADVSHWEQNSVRPVNIVLNPTASGMIVALDAFVKYNYGPVSQVFQTPTLTQNNISGYLTSTFEMAFETWPGFQPSNTAFNAYKTSNDPGWTVTSGSSSPVYEMKFPVMSAAVPGTTTLGWRNADDILFKLLDDTNVTGPIYEQTITITHSHAPLNFSGVSSVEYANSGNKINVYWDNTQVTDDTPFGITSGSYLPHNVRFIVYRRTNFLDPVGTIIYGAGPNYSGMGNNYPNGLSTGVPGAFPDDLVDNTPYEYRVEAVDDTLDHNMTATGNWSGQIKPHDYTAPPAPAFVANKLVSQISSNGGQSYMFRYNGGNSWQKITNFTGYLPDDQSVTLYWNQNNTGVPDYAGSMALQNSTPNWGTVTPESATLELDGVDYPKNTTCFGAQVVEHVAVDHTTVNGLTNGADKYFKVYNYDLSAAYDGSAGTGQQGRNYSASLSITADAGIPPHNINVSLASASRTSDHITVSWAIPSDLWYGGARIIITDGSDPVDPGDHVVASYESTNSETIHTFNNIIDPMGSHKVYVYTFNNNVSDRTMRRYSSGEAISFDTATPDPVMYFYGLPSGSTSIELNWIDPASHFYGVLILRKAGTSGFVYDPLNFPKAGSNYAKGYTVPGSAPSDEVVVYSGPLETAPDTGLSSSDTYYYRIWAYSISNNYSSTYDATAATPGGGAGGALSLGPTTVFHGLNLIAVGVGGQQTPKTLDQSTLIQNGASTGDKVYKYMQGTTNFREATLHGSQWIDDEIEIPAPATWEISPDEGVFIERNSSSPFTWEAR